MTDTTKKTRRSISKARLLKELLSIVTAYGLSEKDSAISELVEAIRNDIVEEAMDK